MNNIINLFIPFIENYISSEFVKSELEKQHFGKVLTIDMREEDC